MNIFKPVTVKWWEVGLLKLAVVCVGIAIGAYWHSFFLPHAVLFLVIGIVLGIYLAIIWYK